MLLINFFLRLFGLKRKRKPKNKKAMIRERNRRLAIIMSHVRSHQRERENAPTTENLARTIDRIKKKKEAAQREGPQKWAKNFSQTGRSRDVEKRVLIARERIRAKREKAKEVWPSK